MDYRVEELARRAGVGVDTIRFYQSRGLLPPPRREGRLAFYGDDHLERLRRIRAWKQQGLTLAWIKRLLERAPDDGEAGLLAAVARERVGRKLLRLEELAERSGVPEPLLRAAEAAGLLEPIRVAGEERFSEADLEMARAGLAILDAGFPLEELLELAVRHARSVQETCERAIDLFERSVRGAREEGRDGERATELFRSLLPQVTRLVALHFQRTLVNRALARLARRREREDLAETLTELESGRLEVRWR